MKHQRRVSNCGLLLGLWLFTAPALAQEADAFEPYFGMKDQFALALPRGWGVYDQGAVLSGKSAKTGPPVVFSAELIDGQAMMSGDKEALQKVLDQLSRVESGALASFRLDRIAAIKGTSCNGFDTKAQKKVLGLIGTDPMFGRGRTIREKLHAEPIVVGGCQGLRVRGKGTASTDVGKTLDVFAASDGDVLFLFVLDNRDEHYSNNVSTFERVISTLRLAVAPTSGN